MNAVKTYKCEGCDCGRVLSIERSADDEFFLRLTDPEFEVCEVVTFEELAQEINETEEGENQFYVRNAVDEMSIILSDEQIADLCAWAGVEGKDADENLL